MLPLESIIRINLSKFRADITCIKIGNCEISQKIGRQVHIYNSKALQNEPLRPHHSNQTVANIQHQKTTLLDHIHMQGNRVSMKTSSSTVLPSRFHNSLTNMLIKLQKQQHRTALSRCSNTCLIIPALLFSLSGQNAMAAALNACILVHYGQRSIWSLQLSNNIFQLSNMDFVPLGVCYTMSSKSKYYSIHPNAL